MKNLVLSLMLLAPSGAMSESWTYEDGSYRFEAKSTEECENLGGSSPLLGECQRHFSNIELNELNNTYSQLYEKLTRDKRLLEESQKKWGEYINTQCHFEAQASKADRRPENAYHNILTVCLNKLRAERTEYLKSINTGCAGCVQ